MSSSRVYNLHLLLIAGLLLFAALLTAPHLTAAAAEADFTVEAVTPYTGYTTARLNIRTGPTIRYTRIDTLEKDAAVTVTGVASTKWLRVTAPGVGEGYVSYRYITVKETGETPASEAAATAAADVAAAETSASEAAEEAGAAESPEETGDTVEEAAAVETADAAADPAQASAADTAGTHEHVYTSTITREATCTQTGIITYTCVDGDDSYTERVPRLEHTPGGWEVVRAATWTKAGLRFQNCTVCGQTLASEELPANSLPLFLIIIGICAAAVVTLIALVARSSRRH